jgi:hypothetical protein
MFLQRYMTMIIATLSLVAGSSDVVMAANARARHGD